MRGSRWQFRLLAPTIVFLVAIFLGPFLYMVWLSFTDLSYAVAERSGNPIGLANYSRALFDDEIFLGSIGRSALFVVLCVLPQILIGIIVAELLHGRVLAQRLLTPLLPCPFSYLAWLWDSTGVFCFKVNSAW